MPADSATARGARRLSDRAAIGLGQPIVVENRAGAAATVGAQAVAPVPLAALPALHAVQPPAPARAA